MTSDLGALEPPAAQGSDRSRWRDRYAAVRSFSLQLAAPLSAEDQQIQSMPDVSPTKWHLAHVTWFFETFLLSPRLAGYRPFDAAYGFLFNSYYEQVGERHPRPRRGLLSRPSLEEVLDSIAAVGQATGVPARAERLVAGLRARRWRAAGALPARWRRRGPAAAPRRARPPARCRSATRILSRREAVCAPSPRLRTRDPATGVGRSRMIRRVTS